MVRFVLRALGLLFIAAALLAVVFDAARSIAASAPTLTSFETAWFALDPASLAAFELFVRIRAGEAGAEPVVAWILAAPASAVLTAAGFILVLVGAPRGRTPVRANSESGPRAAGDLS